MFSGLGIAFILAQGPLAQAITVAFLSGHTSSIYDGKNVAQFMSAKTYIKAALWPPYLITGFVSAIFMIRSTTKRAVLAWGTIAIGGALTIIDAFSSGTEGLLVSALCNLVAGFLLAIFTLVLAINSNVVHDLSNGSLKFEKILWIIWPFIGYICLAAILFFALNFLTTIPSIPVSFRLTPPLTGYYATDKNNTCEGANDNGNSGMKCNQPIDGSYRKSAEAPDTFSILGKFKEANNGRVKFTGFGDGLTFEWLKGVQGTVIGTLWMAQGCTQEEQIREVMKSKPIFRGNLKNLKIIVDKGMSEFFVIEPKSQEIQVSDGSVHMFWVTPSSKDPSRIEVSRFLKNGTIRVFNRFETTIYELVIVPLVKNNNSGLSYQPRRITYTINDTNTKNISISMGRNLTPTNTALTCQILPTHAVEGGFSALARTPYVGIIFSINPPKSLNTANIGQPNNTTVSGASGWISSEGYPAPDLHKAAVSGKLSQLSLIGTVRDLVIDGQAIATSKTSILQVSGKLTGSTVGSSILMEGNIDYLLLNRKRMTATRWEQLDTGIRIPIILGIPTGAYFLLNFLIFTLRRRIKEIWLFPK